MLLTAGKVLVDFGLRARGEAGHGCASGYPGFAGNRPSWPARALQAYHLRHHGTHQALTTGRRIRKFRTFAAGKPDAPHDTYDTLAAARRWWRWRRA